MIKITLSSVLKKDLTVIGYLLSFGVGTYLAQRYITSNEVVSLVFGATVNYILFRVKSELDKTGYIRALTK